CSLTVKLGEQVASSFRTFEFSYSYKTSTGVVKKNTASYYILNIQDSSSSSSKPKLMVSDFSSDTTIKAGETFNFSLDIHNTNATVDAKNIKVIITSESGSFSVTEGGNSFFINSIKAGETESITINLKASAALTTGSYPINVRMEYEYDGMKDEKDGVVDEELNVSAKESLRPSVQNIQFGGWKTPVVNQASTLSAQFNNMGKSTLNNVYVTVSGDFMLANNSTSYYIGNLMAGSPMYEEFDVIPLVSGEACGILTLHMEDSTGEEFSVDKEFTAFISSSGNIDADNGVEWNTDEGDFPDFGDIDVEPEKKEIPKWVFFAGGGVLVVAAVVVVTVIVKKKKKEEEDNDEY
nr:hypothetical protein [Lachnospiraceae bacterium]